MIAKSKKIKSESKQTIFFSVILGVLFFTVIGYLVVSNFKINSKRAELNSQLIKLQAEFNALEAKKAQLQAQVSESTNDAYLEKEARDTFNLKQPGEEVVTVLPAESNENPQKEQNFWQKIVDKIKFW